eukprot:scaffold40021_cov30-Tisochrysis_lutea.AAC.1
MLWAATIFLVPCSSKHGRCLCSRGIPFCALCRSQPHAVTRALLGTAPSPPILADPRTNKPRQGRSVLSTSHGPVMLTTRCLSPRACEVDICVAARRNLLLSRPCIACTPTFTAHVGPPIAGLAY